MRIREVMSSVFVLMAVAGICSGAEKPCICPFSPSPPAGKRFMVFISDLHIGPGHDATQPDGWNRFEDFRWDDELRAFLEKQVALAREKGHDRSSRIDLVLVGDTFELWQSFDGRGCQPSVKDAGCTEQEARERLARIVSQHPKALDALGWFAEQDDNRVTLIPGNHDAALLFDGVRTDALSAITKGGDRALRSQRIRVATEGYWRSADGRVYAEHGHQIGDDPNRFDDWPTDPFVAVNGSKYLRQPWGESFVQHFFNEYEERFPIVDNLSDEIAGLEYGARAGGVLGTGAAVWRAARFLATQTSWRQTIQLLGPLPTNATQDPKWDILAVRKRFPTPDAASNFVLGSYPPDDPVRKAIDNEERQGRLLPNLDGFGDDEIKVLCTLRWLRSLNQQPGDHIELCPGTVPQLLGGVSGNEEQLNAIRQGVRERLLGGAKDERFRQHLTCARKALPRDRPTQDFELFVFAHTHEAVANYAPFGGETWSPVVVNDGAWQRTATPDQLCAIAQARGKLSNAQALNALRPGDLPPCYPFVTAWIDDQQRLKHQLLYWRQESGQQKGQVSALCQAPQIPAEECNSTPEPDKPQSSPRAGTRTRVESRAEVQPEPQQHRQIVAIIGIDKYQGNWKPLTTPVADAESFADLLEQKFGFFKWPNPLLDEEATVGAIDRLLQTELPSYLTENDDLVLYFAGHGDERGRVGYLISWRKKEDSDGGDYIPIDEQFLKSAAQLKARHVLVILDACKSGVALNFPSGNADGKNDAYTFDVDGTMPQIRLAMFNGSGLRLARVDMPEHDKSDFNSLALPRSNPDLERISRYVITSTMPRESAADQGGPFPGHSVFSGVLLNALKYEFIPEIIPDEITASEIGVFLKREVPLFLKQTPRATQFPGDQGGELLLTFRRRPQEERVAILPFRNSAHDEAAEQMRFTLPQELLARLQPITGAGAYIRPFESAAELYKDRDPTIAEVQRDLKARRVIKGNIRGTEPQIQLDVTISSSDSGKPFYFQHFEGPNLLDLVNTMVPPLVAALQISSARDMRTTHEGTADPDAYKLLLRGLQLEKELIKENNQSAIETLQKVVEEDPSYARGHATLAEAYVDHYWWNFSNDASWVDRAEQSAHKALELTPQLPEAHDALGRAFEGKGLREQAVREFIESVRLNPRYVNGLANLARYSFYMADYTHAVEALNELSRLDPTQNEHIRLAMCNFFTGNLEEARAENDLAEKLAHGDDQLTLVAFTYVWLEDLESARRVLRKLEQQNPKPFSSQEVRAWLYTAKGETNRAQELMKTIMAQRSTFGILDEMATLFAIQGDTDRAIDLLEEAVSKGAPNYAWYSSDFFRRLRGNKRYEAVLKTLRDEHARLEPELDRVLATVARQ